MASTDDTPRRREPGRLVRLLHLAALSAGVVAAPIFAVVGDHPQFFTAFGARERDTWMFLAVVLVVPPLVLWIPGLVVSLFSRVGGWALQLLAVAVLCAAGGLILAKALGAGDAASYALALLVAGGATAAYALLPPVRLIATVAAPLPLVVLLLFVLGSPSGSIARGDGNPAGANVDPAKRIPVVMVEFDEFPLYSIENAKGQIDARRFPNFAVLKNTSTWYPRYTPVYDETTRLSASLLTGQHWKQHAKPWYTAYPRTLYKLLGRHYRIVASEEATDLCPPTLCARVLKVEGWRLRLRHLLHGAGHEYLRGLAPPGREADMAPADVALGKLRFHPKNRKPRVLSNLLGPNRIPRWDHWVQAIGAGKGPTLYFKHVLLPHTPWRYLPDGREYRRDPHYEPIPGFGSDASPRDPWLNIEEEQRHLLQTRLSDRLLGHLIQRLKDEGIYDRALVMVFADHGQAFFSPGANRHQADDHTWPQLGTAPMFIKYPGQTRGAVSQRRMRTYDLVPTIADVLGAKIPWKIKGRSVLDTHSGVNQRYITITERKHTKTITRPMSEWKRMLDAQRAHQIRLFGTGTDAALYDIGPRKDLHGRRVSTLSVAPHGRYSTPLWDKPYYRTIDLHSSFLPSNIAGRIDGGSLPRGLPIAVAINGRIAATGRTVRVAGFRKAFYTVMVPPSSFRQGRNTVEVYFIRGSTLVPIGGT